LSRGMSAKLKLGSSMRVVNGISKELDLV
jgi:hypothetical protein